MHKTSYLDGEYHNIPVGICYIARVYKPQPCVSSKEILMGQGRDMAFNCGGGLRYTVYIDSSNNKLVWMAYITLVYRWMDIGNHINPTIRRLDGRVMILQ